MLLRVYLGESALPAGAMLLLAEHHRSCCQVRAVDQRFPDVALVPVEQVELGIVDRPTLGLVVDPLDPALNVACSRVEVGMEKVVGA